MLLGVDVGGTFTDAVLAAGGRLFTAKAPSTPADQSEGVLAAVQAVLEKAGASAEQVEHFSHGMTVATNALLEGKGARTALIATEGFTDVVELARQDRPSLYRLCEARPAPLVPPELRFGAPERMTPSGPLEALTPQAAGELADRLREVEDLAAVAVALLHSYRHPQHELLIRDVLRRELPQLHVSLSHEVVGTFREYERAATTEVDAALSPLLSRYLHRLSERSREAALPRPAVMSSSGGLIDAAAAAEHAALTVLSGPAAGAAGAAFLARESQVPAAVCFDMGGTSCDVCVVRDGEVQERTGGELAGRPLALPMLAVHAVGAGGGSIAWADPGGALRVGPRSAGAEPGPACYGRGGEQPTVTDANLLLGYLSHEVKLAGGVELDRERARAAIAPLAERLGLDLIRCAEGIVQVASTEMVRAIRVVTVERGIDPRDHALLAFGGAGPLHACAIAEQLGMRTILCPRASGVLAALGLVVSPVRRDVQRSLFLAGADLTPEAVAAAVSELARAAREAVDGDDVELRATYELRCQGQAFELAVPGELEPDPAALRANFDALHEQRYGYSDPDAVLELVTARVTALRATPEPDLGGGTTSGPPTRRTPRSAVIGGEEVQVAVISGELVCGERLSGPAVVELPEATLLLAPGWAGEVDERGTIRLRHNDERES